jgi:hypothetical protein
MMRSWSCAANLFCLVILIVVITVNVDAQSNSDDDASEWLKFKTRHQKHYKTHNEDTRRFNLWLENRASILAQNAQAAAGLSSFTLGDNEFSDWSQQEFTKLLGFRSSRRSTLQGKLMPTMKPGPQYNPYTNTVPVSQLPVSINWTAQGAVNPVQNRDNAVTVGLSRRVGLWKDSISLPLANQSLCQNRISSTARLATLTTTLDAMEAL